MSGGEGFPVYPPTASGFAAMIEVAGRPLSASLTRPSLGCTRRVIAECPWLILANVFGILGVS